MSHTILVPKRKLKRFGAAAPANATLATVAGLVFASPDGGAALAAGDEVLVACTGAARGVSVVGNDEGTAVRIFTASSRADIDLAIQAVLALMGAGRGKAVINEDDEEFSSAAEIDARYDDDFRSAYVRWGPIALAEQALAEDSSLLLTGPWSEVSMSAAELRTLREANDDDDGFAAAVIEHLVTIQARARPLHAAFASGAPTALEGDPTRAAGAVAAWIANEPRTADPSRTWRLVAALPEAVLAEPRLLRTALLIAAAAAATDADAGPLRTLAVRVAAADPEFAGSLGDVAHVFAQEGQFAQALALFDVVMALPALSTATVRVATGAPGAIESRHEEVAAQATWVCNATWAVQSDNNKQPVDPVRARRYLTQAAPFAPSNPPIFYNLACIALELGDPDAALGYVAKAKQHGFPNMAGIAADPLFASLRAHPRWTDAFAGRL